MTSKITAKKIALGKTSKVPPKTSALPGISCYCSTYGRPKHLLENSIQCFLEQDYEGPKELVIFNDFSEQELVFDHPEVRIINHPERIKPLGRKFNMNIELCRYDILATWEDDDFFLRNRLSFGLANMKDGVFHTQDGFLEKSKGIIEIAGNFFHSQHIFTRELFKKIGGYKEIDQCSLDIDLIEAIKKELGEYSMSLSNVNDYSYIYVWAESGSYHGSGLGEGNRTISDSAAEKVQEQVAKGVVRVGKVALTPKLRYNVYEFLPTAQGIFKSGRVSVFYGVEDHQTDVTAHVIKQCIENKDSGSAWHMPASDNIRAQVFVDPLPNILKKVFIKTELLGENRTLVETITADDECLFQYSDGKISITVAPGGSVDFAKLYADGCNRPSDIHEHLPTLYNYAKQCQHITEMGVRFGVSTRAFLYASPKRLVSYDLFIDLTVNSWFDQAKLVGFDYEYIQANTLEIAIEPTDLLFIDTLHNYDQVKKELELHACAVGRYIVFHDTVSYGERGESYAGHDNLPGLRLAIDEFLGNNPEWKIVHNAKNCNGLMVIARITSMKFWALDKFMCARLL